MRYPPAIFPLFGLWLGTLDLQKRPEFFELLATGAALAGARCCDLIVPVLQIQGGISRLELGPHQKSIVFAWLVENKGTQKKQKTKRGANSGEVLNNHKKSPPKTKHARIDNPRAKDPHRQWERAKRQYGLETKQCARTDRVASRPSAQGLFYEQHMACPLLNMPAWSQTKQPTPRAQRCRPHATNWKRTREFARPFRWIARAPPLGARRI